MPKNSFVAVLLLAIVLSFIPARHAIAKEAKPTQQLLGSWVITHRPVNSAGIPCPFLPETIEFLKGQTVVMSNLPARALPYKTELTAAETQAFEERSERYKGKKLLLVKPSQQMDWRATPMVYIYSVNKDTLSLTVEGWDSATFKRVP